MTTFKLTSEFGAVEPVRNGVHTGIDLAMGIGTPLRSVIDGWITKVWSGEGTLGKGVTIKGVDGREYIYGHMDSVALKVGDAVRHGSLIGESGNTGNSHGAHLHFAVKENGQYVDPTEYKPVLDELSGGGLANTRASMDACLPSEDISWYDVGGRMQSAFDSEVCETKREIMSYLKALLETTAELSYGIALIGGGVLVILRIAGMTRATKYFGVLQVSHILIRALMGGAVSR